MEAAMPSMVSLMKEKTIPYLKCHSRGFEKVIWPIACIALLVISIVLLAVACGTPHWLQVLATLLGISMTSLISVGCA